VRIDLARSMVRDLAAIDAQEREHLLDELRDEGRRVLSAAGVAPDAIAFRYGIDARYAGQGNEVTVWVGEGDTWPATDAEVRERFEAEYRRIYGLTIPDVGIQTVTWRLSAVSATKQFDPGAVPAGAGVGHTARRPVVFARGEAAIEVPVYARTSLGAGDVFDGPAIVEERETTVVIRPGWHVEVATDGSLVATRAHGASGAVAGARDGAHHHDGHGEGGQGA
jgi:N-methylhydantoinase A